MQVLLQGTRIRLFSATAFLGLALAGTAQAAPFTIGNLVLTRVAGGPNGDGSTALSGASIAWVDEYTRAGVLVQSIKLPNTANGSQKAFTLSGGQNFEGAIQISENHQYFTVAGYNQPTLGGNTNSDPAATTARVVARIDMNGNVDTSTALTDAVSSQSVRSAYTRDGSAFWVAGNGGNAVSGNPTNGIRYAALGSSTSTPLGTAGLLANYRVVGAYNGQMYVTSGNTSGSVASQRGLDFVRDTTTDNTPVIPTNNTNTVYSLGGFSNTTSNSPDDFWFKDNDTLYVAENNSTNNNGVQKYLRTAGASTAAIGDDIWTYQYTIALGVSGSVPSGSNGVVNAHGLTGWVDDTGATTLFATSFEAGAASNRLWAIVDNGTAASAVQTLLQTTAANNAFRGVDVVLPEPVSMSLIAFAGLGLLGRRRA